MVSARIHTQPFIPIMILWFREVNPQSPRSRTIDETHGQNNIRTFFRGSYKFARHMYARGATRLRRGPGGPRRDLNISSVKGWIVCVLTQRACTNGLDASA